MSKDMTMLDMTHLATKEDVANVRTEIVDVKSEIGWQLVGLFIAQTTVLGTILATALNWTSKN